MRKFVKKFSVLLLLAYVSVLFSGCAPCKPCAKVSKPAPKSCGECGPVLGDNTVAFYYPCGSKSCSVVYVEKTAPKQVQVGEKFDYVINVTNVLKYKLTDVKVTDVAPGNFTVLSSSPKASAGMVWDLGTLMPNETKQIKITGSAKTAEPMTNCIKITYTPLLCVMTTVIKPSLALTADSTPEVILCDKILLTFTATNNGTGPARNVIVTSSLPSGIETIDGKSSITKTIDCLKGGESQKFDYTLKAMKPGKYTFDVDAKAQGNLNAKASTSTVVRQPKLTIAKTGTEKVYIGRPVKYTITVKNVGDGDAENTVVTDVIPANMSFSKADHNGTLVGNNVRWNLGTLEPNDSSTLNLELVAVSKGTGTNQASANGECCDKVNASASTLVEGIPALLLEVVDLSDPIEIGANVTYVITVTNQGSAVANNIKLVCTLEANQEFVSSSGSSKSEAKDKVISFIPLPQLAPQAKATWNVVVKSLKPGDVRFTVEMTSAELKRPVSETESTHLY